jgi:hypothetical protein
MINPPVKGGFFYPDALGKQQTDSAGWIKNHSL